MKKYFIQRSGQPTRPHYPFWLPWGMGGCLWRTILFILILAIIIILLWLLSSIKGCERFGNPNAGYRNPIELPDSVPDNNYPGSGGGQNGGNGGQTPGLPGGDMPGGAGGKVPDLPGGQIPPPTEIIPNPEDPVHNIAADQLMVIIDPEGKSNKDVMEDFKLKFKAQYPGAEYVIPYTNPTTMMAMLVVPKDQRESIRKMLPSQIRDIKFYVENVEAIGQEQSRITPNDPLLDKTWHLDPVLAPEGWTISTGDPDIKVAVIDSYFDLSHPDFNGLRIEDPVSFENLTTDVAPPPGTEMGVASHGTHVLGIIAAQMNNGIGSTGIAPNVTIMPISLGKNMNTFSVMEAILYATYKGANVINLSLGADFNEEVLKRMSPQDMVEYAKSHGERGAKAWEYVYDILDERNVLAVYASGNENAYTLLDNSKRADNIIIVDAVGTDLKKTNFSNFANVDELNIKNSVISAPGKSILSTIPGRRLAEMDGTSMAAPVVTAAVALIKSTDPTLSNKEIIQLLQETGKPIPNKEIGPLLQIYPALKKVKDNRGKWDDFIKNPKGIWKTIEKFPVHVVSTGQWLADCQQYIIFETENSGILELHAVGPDRVWNSRFNAIRSDNEVILKFDPQVDVNGIQYIPNEFHLKPDQNGQITMENYINGTLDDKDRIKFVKKIQKDDRKNTNKRNI